MKETMSGKLEFLNTNVKEITKIHIYLKRLTYKYKKKISVQTIIRP